MINKDTKFLIIGLGLMGGSYALALKQQGYAVSAITKEQSSIDYAAAHGIIDKGDTDINETLVKEADIIVFALYPHVFIDWIKNNRNLFRKGQIITDVTGVKHTVVKPVQELLNGRCEFIAAHPMAGREVYGVENATSEMFKGANYIVVPTENNTPMAIDTAKRLGEILGFARISVLSPEEHDKMIGFVSQLTHCIAVALMTCNDNTHLVDYTGDSFRDLTRIANINEDMWTELFLLNRDVLANEIDVFAKELERIKNMLQNGDSEGMKEVMRLSTKRRKLFNK